MEVLGKIKDTLKSILEWTLFIFLLSLLLDYLREGTKKTKLHKLGTSAGYIVKGLIGLVKGLTDVLIDKDGREKLNKKREKALIRKGLIKDPTKEDRDQSEYKN